MIVPVRYIQYNYVYDFRSREFYAGHPRQISPRKIDKVKSTSGTARCVDPLQASASLQDCTHPRTYLENKNLPSEFSILYMILLHT